MEKKAKEFLELSGKLYEFNKKKWSKMVDGFDDDVYNDTIIKVYECILDGEDIDGDLVGYWFKSFKNNLYRHKKYKTNQTKESLDNVKDDLVDEDKNDIDYSNVSVILLKIRNHFDRNTFVVFRMYLLCNMSYDKIDELTGVDSKGRITRVKKWLNDNKNNK